MSEGNIEYNKLSSRAIREMIHDETRKEIEALNASRNANKEQKKKMTEKGKAIITAFLVSIAGWIGIGQVEEYKYQKAIDEHNESVLMIVPSENLDLSETEKRDSVEYLSAVFSYLNDELSASEREEYRNIIDENVRSGKAINLEEKALTRQLDLAKKMGDADSIKKIGDLEETSVTFYTPVEEPNGFRVSGVTREYYPVEGLHIFSNDVPENLIKAARDCIKYQNVDWGYMDKDKRVAVGIQIGENIETLMNEHYIITNKGIERINEDDFKELAENYNKEKEEETYRQREEIYKKYGVNVNPVAEEIQIEELEPEL